MAGNMDGFSIDINADDSRARRTFNNFFNFMNKAENGVKKLNGSLEKTGKSYNGAFQDAKGQWRNANGQLLTMKERADMLGKSFKNNTVMAGRFNKTIMGVQHSIAMYAGLGLGIAGVTTALTASVRSAMEWESAFAGVRKTIDMTESEYADLADTILQMTREMPQTSTEIAGIAEAAGQLGISKENLSGFTETMAQLGVATNMSSADAANSLARLANITGMPQTEFDRLGATVVSLGNSLATTESEIVDMSLRIAGAGNQVGLTEAQITSFAGALSSVGLTAEAGGSAISRTFLNINTAVKSGGDALEGFAEVAGMSGSEFKQAFEEDAAGAMVTFLKGLDNINKTGGDTSAVLKELGIRDTLMIDTLQRAAGAGDLFTDALKNGNAAWEDNTALVNEANERYKTYESQVQIMKNAFNELAITVGTPMKNGLAPVVGGLARGAQVITDTLNVLSGNKSLQEVNKNTRGAVTAIVQYIESLKPAIDGIKAVFDIAMDVAGTVGGAIAVGFQATLKAVVPLANAIGRLLSIISQIPGLVPVITGLIAAFAAFRTISVIMGASTVAVGAFQTAVLLMTNPVARAIALAQVWQKVQMLLNATLLANPIGLVVAVLVGLGTALYVAYTRSETFRNIVNTLFQSIANGARVAVQWMQTATDKVVNFFQSIDTSSKPIKAIIDQLKIGFQSIGGAISYILPLVGAIGLRMMGITGPIGLVIGAILSLSGFFYRLYQTNETFANGVNTAWSNIVSVFNNVITALKPIFDVFKDAANQFATELGPQFAETGRIISQSLGELKPVISQVIAAFAELGKAYTQQSLVLLPMLLDTFSRIFPMIMQVVQMVFPIVIKLIQSIIPLVLDIVQMVLPALLSIVQAVFPVILSIIQAVMPIVLQLIKAIVPIITQLVSILIPAILSVVQAVFPVILTIIKTVMPIIVTVLKLAANIITAVLIPAIEFILDIVNIVFPAIMKIIQNILNIVIGVIKFFTSVLKGDWKGAFDALLSITKNIFQAIWTAIKAAANLIVSILKGAWNLILSLTKTIFGGIWNWIRDTFNNIVNKIKSGANAVYTLMKTAWQNAWNKTTEIFNNIKNKVKGTFDDIVGFAKDLPSRIGKGIKNAAGAVMDGIKAVSNKLIDGLELGVNGVIKGVNWVLDKVGSDKKYDLWEAPQYAKGTPTGGHPGGPMIVGDGGLPELVVMPNGRMMMSPATDTLMNAPKGTQVLSGERTKRMTESGSLPFYNMGTGIINKASDLWESTKSGVKKGYNKVKDTAINIFDYIKNPGKLVSKALEAVGFNGLPDLSGAVGSIMKGGYNKVKDTAVDYVKGLFDGSSGEAVFMGDGNVPGNVQSWISAAIQKTGVPMSWLGPLSTIAMKESGGRTGPSTINRWDINAKRGIPSMGLMQTIGPTFNAFKESGWNDIMNPIHNAAAAINYIISRYGTAFNVPGIRNMAAGLPYVGYATGGFIDKMHTAVVGEGNKKEVVIPLEAKQRMQPFADATAAGLKDTLTNMGGNGETEYNQTNNFYGTQPITPAEARRSQKKAAKDAATEWGLN
jgi:TP901 family phage tail tape measure protein